MKYLELSLKYKLNDEQTSILYELISIYSQDFLNNLENLIISLQRSENTIHILYEGRYSGMKTIGIFTNDHKSKLDKLVEQEGCEYSIESFKINNRIDSVSKALTFIDNGFKVYEVFMRKNGDSVSAVYYSQDPVDDLYYDYRYEGFKRIERISFSNSENSENFKNSLLENELVLFCTVWAKDKEHAVKIVNEKRIQYLATNTWCRKDLCLD